MKSIVLSLVSALSGAAAVLLWHSRFAADPVDAGPDIAALSRQVSLRDGQLAGLRRELANLTAAPSDATADPNKPPDINRLLNEARPLLRSLSVLFEDKVFQTLVRTDWVAGGVSGEHASPGSAERRCSIAFEKRE